MSVEKTALNDELMDSVTGGTVIPQYPIDNESLNAFVTRLNGDVPNRFSVAQIIKWNGLDPNTDPYAKLDPTTALNVLY